MFYMDSPRSPETIFSEIFDSTGISKIMSINWVRTGVTVTFNSNSKYFFLENYYFVLLGS